ncbi:MAG: acyl carrier protein [Spirochaetales bacterium]|nr:acyl carrier protein [Spirochaetales bacterium]
METIVNKIKDVLEKIGIDAEDITMEMHFQDDLGVDSLLYAEFGVKMQKQFDLPLKKEIMNYPTVGELAEHIQSSLAVKAS